MVDLIFRHCGSQTAQGQITDWAHKQSQGVLEQDPETSAVLFFQSIFHFYPSFLPFLSVFCCCCPLQGRLSRRCFRKPLK